MNIEIEARRLALVVQLKALAHGEGVQRSDLVELLQTDLAELAALLRVDTSQSEATVRKSVEAALFALIVQIPPPEARRTLTVQQRKKQYVGCLLVCFNVNTLPEVRTLKLMARRKWLARPDRGPMRVTERTSQRELEYGIAALAEILVAGEFVFDGTPVDVTRLTEALESQREERSNNSTEGASNRPWYQRRVAVAASASLVVILVSVLGWRAIVAMGDKLGNGGRVTSGPTSISSGSTEPIPSGIQAPSIKIDNSQGWGPDRPVFSVKNPPSYVVFNSITDAFNYGDERSFITCRDIAGGGLTNKLIAENGRTYHCQASIYNDISDELDKLNGKGNPATWAVGTKLKVLLPKGKIYNPGVSANISALNATEVWSACNFVAAQPMEVKYVSGTARMISLGTPDGGLKLKDDDSGDNPLFSSDGVLLGYDKQDGVVRHSFQYAVHVLFEIKTFL